ncbi:hypothetical protein CesoFtcFv8_026062 [Champsocephalus esox]|uniref:LEM domain-containing protein n=1 Tax=Champsocephalus esox TaxID=159716 RepID=A0AAN8B214_9TELE|nr:hypothetical protein CesoFtcFv8_026062 [Champsocephalus esox]
MIYQPALLSPPSQKATRKTDKVLPDEMDVTVLTDGGLMDELQKHGVNAGPIVASTRKLYERKLQKLLDEGPAQPPLPEVIVTETQVNHNGNSESDLYSDKEDEVIAEPVPVPEPEPEPEPVPVVERPVRSRGKTPITTRTRSSQHHTVEKIAAGDQPQKVVETEVLKELFPNDVNSPTGITATCRRPIRGAAHRPLKSSDLWNGDENSIFSPKTTKTTSSFSSYTQSCTDGRVTSLPISTTSTSSFSSSRLLSVAPPAGHTKAAPRSMALWKKLFLLAVVGGFLFLVYQAMETNIINPFEASETEVASSGTA